MIKISSSEIADIFKFKQNNAIFVEKKPVLAANQYKASYSVINFEEQQKEMLTKNAYLLKKFGYSYEKIIQTIPNFLQCDSAILYDKRVLVMYPNGETGIFSREGDLTWSGNFTYHDKLVKHIALDGQYFWTVCPQENCALKSTCKSLQVDLRVGDINSSTFINPTYISTDEKDIFVCCDNNKVRKIDGANFTVSDYREFKEEVKEFHKFGEYELAVLRSGTYLLEDTD